MANLTVQAFSVKAKQHSYFMDLFCVRHIVKSSNMDNSTAMHDCTNISEGWVNVAAYWETTPHI